MFWAKFQKDPSRIKRVINYDRVWGIFAHCEVYVFKIPSNIHDTLCKLSISNGSIVNELQNLLWQRAKIICDSSTRADKINDCKTQKLPNPNPHMQKAARTLTHFPKQCTQQEQRPSTLSASLSKEWHWTHLISLSSLFYWGQHKERERGERNKSALITLNKPHEVILHVVE